MNDIKEEQKEFTRGLEGVVAAESNISYVDGVHGRLLYQGYDIHDLAEHASFEETVFLLWRCGCRHGPRWMRSRPSWWPRCGCPARCWRCSSSPRPAATRWRCCARRSACWRISTRTSKNLREANWRKARRLVAQVPTIIADLHRIRSGLPVLSPDPGFDVSSNFLYMMRGTPPNELERSAMEVLMVLHAITV